MVRFALVPASYVLLLREGPSGDEVLLHLRQDTGYMDGRWASLAGHVEEDESALTAACREALEEGGVVVAEDDLVPLCAVHRTQRGGGPVEQRVDFFFVSRRWTGEPTVREPAKNAGFRWFPLSDLPEAMPPQEVDVLRLLASGSPVPPVMVRGF
ncbi:NUDIX domain-containing protein [Solicola sp. PLA-1-18]|uniref:NUDIX domain-containing protein n=1 Tax=Solicola sp. PLA-1-18 TaxID=3380532 RepID=UPI003B80FFD9